MDVVKTIQMSVEDWIAVQDNPIQRDTEKHAAKAKHLLTPLPTHQFVFAAELPSGKLVKLDGHTRALMWRRGDIPQPLRVSVGIVHVKTITEAEELYKTFDSTNALETLRDKVSGAFNRYNFNPESSLLKAGAITHALRIAYAVLMGTGVASAAAGGKQSKTAQKLRADPYEMIKEFSGELAQIDTFHLRSGQASAGILAAFVLTLRRHGEFIIPFWRAVFGNAGVKAHGRMDAVQALNELMLARRGNYGGSAAIDLCSRAVMAAEKWLKDETLGAIPRPLDLTGYLYGHETPRVRLIKADDARRAREAKGK